MGLLLEIGLLAVGLFFGYFARDFLKKGPSKPETPENKRPSNFDMVEKKMDEFEKKMNALSAHLEKMDFDPTKSTDEKKQ